MKCPHCGNDIHPDDLFCESCGSKLSPQPPAAFKPSDSAPAPSHISDSYMSAPSATAFSAQPPVKSKGHAKIWIAAGVVLVLALGAGGYYVYTTHPEWIGLAQKEDTSGITSAAVNEEYTVLTTSSLYAKAFSQEADGYLNAGSTVTLVELQEDESGQRWGQDDQGNWVLVKDDTYTYLIPASETQYTLKAENAAYTLNRQTSVYPQPLLEAVPVSSLDKSQEVYVYETTVLGNTTWGRIASSEWIVLQEEDVVYAAKKETAKTDTTANSSSSSTSSSSSSSSASSSSSSDSTSQKSLDGYTIGYYTLNYNMKTRVSPDYSAATTGSGGKKGDTVYIADIERGSSDSIWGELSSKGSGVWMCIHDNDYNYLSKK